MEEMQTSTTVKPEVVFIEDLLSDIGNGQLRLPGFQRPFVWKPADMRLLLDSIYKGYPIGSLLIWDSPDELTSLKNIGPIPVPDPPERPISYILDGHQRLTTMFSALCLPPDFPLTRKQSDWKFWLFFDLDKLDFMHITDGKKVGVYFPLRSIIKTMDYLRECRRIETECGEKAEQYLKRADEMARRFKNYKIPVTRIKGGTPKEAVEIFARLNSRGFPIAPDHMVAALTYQEDGKTSLSEHMDDILDEMNAYRFGGIPRKQILQTILGAAGMDINMNEWEAIAKRLQPDLGTFIEKSKKGLLGATRFLFEEIGVPGNSFLPYVNQIVLLSAFFWNISEDRPVPEDKLEILKKWFWSTSLTGWFAGANPSQLRDALRDMDAFAQSEADEVPLTTGGTARPIPARYDSRTARIRCLMIFLFSLKPRYSDGSFIKPEEISDEKRGFEYVFKGNISRELLSNPANRVLLPRKPGKTIKDQILSPPADKRNEFLQSHCISEECFECIRLNDPERFIDRRQKYMIEKESEFIRSFVVEPFDANAEEFKDEPEIDTE